MASMKAMFVYVTIFNVVYCMALLVYFPVVYLNIVFTSDDLPVNVVPYYSSALGSRTTHAYYFYWWEYASDMLRIFPPILMYMCMCTSIVYKSKEVKPYLITLVFILVIEVAKIVHRSVDWMNCGGAQFCRNFNVLVSPLHPNYVFITSFGLSTYFFLAILFYFVLLKGITSAYIQHEYAPLPTSINGEKDSRKPKKMT